MRHSVTACCAGRGSTTAAAATRGEPASSAAAQRQAAGDHRPRRPQQRWAGDHSERRSHLPRLQQPTVWRQGDAGLGSIPRVSYRPLITALVQEAVYSTTALSAWRSLRKQAYIGVHQKSHVDVPESQSGHTWNMYAGAYQVCWRVHMCCWWWCLPRFLYLPWTADLRPVTWPASRLDAVCPVGHGSVAPSRPPSWPSPT